MALNLNIEFISQVTRRVSPCWKAPLTSSTRRSWSCVTSRMSRRRTSSLTSKTSKVRTHSTVYEYSALATGAAGNREVSMHDVAGFPPGLTLSFLATQVATNFTWHFTWEQHHSSWNLDMNKMFDQHHNCHKDGQGHHPPKCQNIVFKPVFKNMWDSHGNCSMASWVPT